MNIAICDDNMEDLLNMVSIIKSYKASNNNHYEIEYTTFQSPLDLIAALENGQEYDIILLDILMPCITGIETAQEIRQFNKDIKIIFITSSSEFAVESYSVGAYFYALKPIGKEKLFTILDKVISKIESQLSVSFLIKSKTGLTRIYINKLEFAEVISRTIFYHLSDGSIIEAIGSMVKLSDILLTEQRFIKSHRSYIINMEYINTLSQKEIKMQSLALVPMSKSKYAMVKSAYINFTFESNKNL